MPCTCSFATWPTGTWSAGSTDSCKTPSATGTLTRWPACERPSSTRCERSTGCRTKC
jgi:hypothetical protein